MVQATPGGPFSPKRVLLKIIVTNTPEELEGLSNAFRRTHNVKFGSSKSERLVDADGVIREFYEDHLLYEEQ